jgi:flotillin
MHSILLAQNQPGSLYFIILVVLVMLMFCFTFSATLKYYKRCPSNRILVVFGKTARGEPATCIHGGARFVLPLIQDYAWLSLEPIQIVVPLRAIPSAEDVPVDIRAVFTVAIGTTPDLMHNAALRLLGLRIDDIQKTASEIIVGQFRQIVASMRVDQLVHDPQEFLQRIQASLEPPLTKLGLILLNVTITDICNKGAKRGRS